MNPPKWSQDLIHSAVGYLQSKGYKCREPIIEWHDKSYRQFSSGVCYHDHISINAGYDKRDCKLVILHELAHWALPLTRDWLIPVHFLGHEGHTSEFWDTAWKLYLWARLPEIYCLQREGNYRKGAENAYYKTLNRRSP